MKGNRLIALLLVLGVVTCQPQNEGLQSPSIQRNGNGDERSGKAIEVGSRPVNKLEGSIVGENHPDSEFDDSPNSYDDEDESTPPPVTGVMPKVHEDLWTTIPLEELVRLGNELDSSKFLRDYVSNAKVITHNKTHSEILADVNGVPLLTSDNELVVVKQAKPSFTLRPEPRTGLPMDKSPLAGRSFIASHGDSSFPKQTENEVCTPEKTTVSLPITVPPHMMILPRCAKVERCGGCCLAHVMSCEPVQKEMAKFSFKFLAWTGAKGRPFEYVNTTVVELEKHTKCECKCRKKATDCYPRQVYHENRCSCECRNIEEYENCQKEEMKVWDPDNCMCDCRQDRQCSTGHYLNYNSCKCERGPLLVRRKS